MSGTPVLNSTKPSEKDGYLLYWNSTINKWVYSAHDFSNIIVHKPSDQVYVKQISGLREINLFKITDLNINLLILGTTHQYCHSSNICNPCETKEHCYDLENYVKDLTQNKCVDLFIEDSIDHKKLKLLRDLKSSVKYAFYNDLDIDLQIKMYFMNFIINNYLGNITDESLDINKKYNMIIQKPIISEEDKIKLEEYEMKLKEFEIEYDKFKKKDLSIKDSIINDFTQDCRLNTNLDLRMLNKLLDGFLISEQELSKTIKNLSLEEKDKFIEYFTNFYTVEQSFKTFPDYKDNNLRTHRWDIRAIFNRKEGINFSPFFFLPDLLVNHLEENESVKYRLQSYEQKLIDFIMSESKDIYNFYKFRFIIFYISGVEGLYNPRDTEADSYDMAYSLYDINHLLEENQFYCAGKKLFIEIFQIFKSEFPEFDHITFQDIKLSLNKIQKLIKKQIDKSIFRDDLDRVFSIFTQGLIRDIEPYSFFKGFVGLGLGFTDIYSIARMFKNVRTKGERTDKCNDSTFFNNIIYVGGRAHSRNISNFIRDFFIENPEVELKYKFKNKRCIEFDTLTKLL